MLCRPAQAPAASRAQEADGRAEHRHPRGGRKDHAQGHPKKIEVAQQHGRRQERQQAYNQRLEHAHRGKDVPVSLRNALQRIYQAAGQQACRRGLWDGCHRKFSVPGFVSVIINTIEARKRESDPAAFPKGIDEIGGSLVDPPVHIMTSPVRGAILAECSVHLSPLSVDRGTAPGDAFLPAVRAAGCEAGMARRFADRSRGGAAVYRVMDRIGVGSICAIYRCTFGGSAAAVVFKVARDPCSNSLVLNEAAVLRRLHSIAGADKFLSFLPDIADTIALADSSTSVARQANVLQMHEEIRSPEELYTLGEVRGHHPRGLDPRHVAWIWRRLLTVLGFAHSNDVIHAAVLPMHVLIEPRGHKVILIDWCTAVAGRGGTQPVQVIAGGYTSWYKRQEALQAADGRTGSWNGCAVHDPTAWRRSGDGSTSGECRAGAGEIFRPMFEP